MHIRETNLEHLDGYDQLQQTLKRYGGIDLQFYKSRQMVRRLHGYLSRVKLSSFAELAQKIATDEKALQQLKDFITINVSEFFRNRERFDFLARSILPELEEQFGALHIWSAGCSIGAEPYSIAILIAERTSVYRHTILATDIDLPILEQAQKGVFSEDKLKEVSPEQRRRFFRQVDDGLWQVIPDIRRQVTFRQHDLLQDDYPADMHLILCRNVVIYFTEEAKERVYQRFAESLVPGGYLMVGNTESIFTPQRYGLQSAGPFLYRKMAG